MPKGVLLTIVPPPLPKNRRDSRRARNDAELSDIGVQYTSDGDGLFSTNISDTRLGGWMRKVGDSDGSSTNISETKRKRRRAGDQE